MRIRGAKYVTAFALSLMMACGASSAAPVEYVKVCSLYGAGFYYIPGTDICLKIGGAIEGGWARSNTDFAVVPSFDVTRNNGIWGANGFALLGVPNTPIAIGPRVGFLNGSMGGTVSAPAASPTFSYGTKIGTIWYGDAVFDFNTSPTDPNALHVFFSVGAASVKTDVTGTSGGFVVSDSSTRTGFTGTLGAVYPIANTPVAVFGQYRYIDVPASTVNIPGMVPITGSINVITVGAQWTFGAPLP